MAPDRSLVRSRLERVDEQSLTGPPSSSPELEQRLRITLFNDFGGARKNGWRDSNAHCRGGSLVHVYIQIRQLLISDDCIDIARLFSTEHLRDHVAGEPPDLGVVQADRRNAAPLHPARFAGEDRSFGLFANLYDRLDRSYDGGIVGNEYGVDFTDEPARSRNDFVGGWRRRLDDLDAERLALFVDPF